MRPVKSTIDKLLGMAHVESAFCDSDGYWVMYREGVTSPRSGLRSDHEETSREILKAAREARPRKS